MNDLTLTVTNNNGTEFLVRIVTKGMRYGLNDVLCYDEKDRLFRADDRMIEFYDQAFRPPQYPEWPRGQFITSYFESSLRKDDGPDKHRTMGLVLDNSAPEWALDGLAMEKVYEFLDAHPPEVAL